MVGVDCRATMSEANARQAAETTASSGANCYVAIVIGYIVITMLPPTDATLFTDSELIFA